MRKGFGTAMLAPRTPVGRPTDKLMSPFADTFHAEVMRPARDL